MGRAGASTDLITWFAQFGGRIKPLTEVRSPELLAMVEQLQGFLAEQLALFNGDDSPGNIEVIFSWGSTGLLRFSIRGEPDDIEHAKQLIGDRAEFQPFQA